MITGVGLAVESRFAGVGSSEATATVGLSRSAGCVEFIGIVASPMLSMSWGVALRDIGAWSVVIAV